MDFETEERTIAGQTLEGQMIPPTRLAPGQYIEIDGCICEITKTQHLKSIRARQGKSIIEGIEVFGKEQKTHQMTIRWPVTVFVPNLRPTECVLLQASDGFAKLLDFDQDIREVEISDDLEDKLQQLIEDTSGAEEIVVTVISHSSFVRIINFRIGGCSQ
jgi:translation elongation factor P/translation initiation factor 5A